MATGSYFRFDDDKMTLQWRHNEHDGVTNQPWYKVPDLHDKSETICMKLNRVNLLESKMSTNSLRFVICEIVITDWYPLVILVNL